MFSHLKMFHLKKNGLLFSASLIVVLLLIFIGLIRTAWLSDDVYIAFRAVLNFNAGQGPVFNLGERVQVYTNVLWFWVLVVSHKVTGEIFFTTLFLSIALTLASLFAHFKIYQSKYALLVSLMLLALSKAFIEFGTSGLENPLSYFLIAIYCVLALQIDRFRTNHWLAIAFYTTFSLIILNRYDLLLLSLPLMAYVLFRTRTYIASITGFIPLAIWFLFSFFYYGSILPNTYYAKLNTGISKLDYLRQGLVYYLDIIHSDPIAVLLFASGLLLAFVNKDFLSRSLTVGLLLYLSYILYIGGDFMSGRFFSVPAFTASLIIARSPVPIVNKKVSWSALFVVGLAVLTMFPRAPLFARTDYRGLSTEQLLELAAENTPEGSGIVDERAFYYGGRGLLSPERGFPNVSRWNEVAQTGKNRYVGVICGQLGRVSLISGPSTHWIDSCGLADPFLARLPFPHTFGTWRIGHFFRALPVGYLESVSSDKNLIEDPDLGRFYSTIHFVTTGELFNWERLSESLALSLGKYDHLIDKEFYSNLTNVSVEQLRGEGVFVYNGSP